MHATDAVKAKLEFSLGMIVVVLAFPSRLIAWAVPWSSLLLVIWVIIVSEVAVAFAPVCVFQLSKFDPNIPYQEAY